ncbi:hypothetical protein MSPP1_003386 [Malassezia sp. CBS 17886]|nr:hypothetical protein MSPP1_003386 [Malassezia sp. CBS 17886]
MGEAGFHGVSVEQDARFNDKEEKLLRTTKFPSIYSEQVDTAKVSMQVLRPWIVERVEQLLGFEDDVLVEYVAGLLETEKHPDPRKMQIYLTGFLEGKTRLFMTELWRLLVSAQRSVGGIPRAFVEQKKREMDQKRSDSASVMDEVRRRAAASHGDAPSSAPAPRRWDRGQPPVHANDREPRRGGGGRFPDTFVDRRGNVTRREADAGWVCGGWQWADAQGARAGREWREDRAGGQRPRDRRTPSPPPHARGR